MNALAGSADNVSFCGSKNETGARNDYAAPPGDFEELPDDLPF